MRCIGVVRQAPVLSAKSMGADWGRNLCCAAGSVRSQHEAGQWSSWQARMTRAVRFGVHVWAVADRQRAHPAGRTRELRPDRHAGHRHDSTQSPMRLWCKRCSARSRVGAEGQVRGSVLTTVYEIAVWLAVFRDRRDDCGAVRRAPGWEESLGGRCGHGAGSAGAHPGVPALLAARRAGHCPARRAGLELAAASTAFGRGKILCLRHDLLEHGQIAVIAVQPALPQYSGLQNRQANKRPAHPARQAPATGCRWR